MAEGSSISWTDHTLNLWIGCTKVSTEATGGGACDNCYAERDFDLRKHVAKWGPGEARHKTKTGNQPRKWNREAETFRAQHGHWPRVFAMSLADVFDNEVPDDWHAEFNSLVEATPRLRWMLTTKRVSNIPKMTPPDFFRRNQHVGVIVSVCNQAEAERDIPRLLALKAELGIRWVGASLEPLLGPVDLEALCTGHHFVNALTGLKYHDEPGGILGATEYLEPLDWVIVGGESGPRARPMHPDWVRSLRSQCQNAGTAFHFKQWGEWWFDPLTISAGGSSFHHFDDGVIVQRIGKHRAGRLLAGREHNGFPEALD